jgi:hypothetical protein
MLGRGERGEGREGGEGEGEGEGKGGGMKGRLSHARAHSTDAILRARVHARPALTPLHTSHTRRSPPAGGEDSCPPTPPPTPPLHLPDQITD